MSFKIFNYILLTSFLISCVSPKRLHVSSVQRIGLEKQFKKGMWVRAASIAYPDSLDKIVKTINNLDITDIFVQVVVGGYAYYKSDILPRSQYLSKVSKHNYDPLDSLIKLLHDKPVLIHAWVNTLLAWSLPEPPDSLNHIFHKHPDWFIDDVHNQSMVHYSYTKWKNAGLEGLYLNPVLNEVRQYLDEVCGEIASRYPVDGIHLDFIRYPGILWGLPKNDESAILAGVETENIFWCNLIHYPKLRFQDRWLVWHNWRLGKKKPWMIYQIIQSIKETVSKYSVKQNCDVSAAVFANPSLFRYSFAQDWPDWQEAIDFPVVMSYTPEIGLFSDYLDFALNHRSDVVLGIGFLWPNMENAASRQEIAVKQRHGRGVSYFDFTNIDTLVNLTILKNGMVFEESLCIDSSMYTPLDSIFWDKPSYSIKDTIDSAAIDEDLVFAAFLLSLSLNATRDLARMNMGRNEFIQKISEDVVSFKILDNKIFPIGDELVEPPKREVNYEFLPWGSSDSISVIEIAEKIEKLNNHDVFYPYAGDKFIKAIFDARLSERNKCITRAGIYVFEVKRIVDEQKKIRRDNIENKLLPLYINSTIQRRIEDIFK